MLILVLLVTGACQPSASSTRRPVDVFAQLNGTWRGVFAGYDSQGRELYRIRVRQVYRTINDTTQLVEIEDIMSDGSRVVGQGKNIAFRSADGSLTLGCQVIKSNGDRVEHHGRIIRGPEEDEQIIWYSQNPGRIEVFREQVRQEGNQTVYSINGFGQYGKTRVLMTGRYLKELP